MVENIKAINEVFSRAKKLHSKEEVDAAITSVAVKMNEQLADKNPILLCVMQGGLPFMGSLLTQLSFPLQIDYIHASRYRGNTHGGLLDWVVKPKFDLKSRNVVIVDDILDQGITLSAIVDYCRSENCGEVQTAVLVDKKVERSQPAILRADYTGFEAENSYLVGYGLDYHEYLRNAPGIYAIAEQDK